MEISPYYEVAANLRDNGYHAIPIKAAQKRPAIENWSRFCAEMPSEELHETWEDLPGANVGVACGNIVGLDVDTDREDVIAAVRRALPRGGVTRRGSKGYLDVFRHPAGTDELFTKARFYDPEGTIVAEVLGAGHQFVVPPSIHPDTAKPYVWLSEEGLDSVDIGALPEFPADAIERLAEELAKIGVTMHKKQPKREDHWKRAGAGDNASRLNTRALQPEAIDAWCEKLFYSWMPHLGVTVPEIKHAHSGVWYLQAIWRPSRAHGIDGQKIAAGMKKRPFAFGIHPDGLRDHATGETFTPIDFILWCLSGYNNVRWEEFKQPGHQRLKDVIDLLERVSPPDPLADDLSPALLAAIQNGGDRAEILRQAAEEGNEQRQAMLDALLARQVTAPPPAPAPETAPEPQPAPVVDDSPSDGLLDALLARQAAPAAPAPAPKPEPDLTPPGRAEDAAPPLMFDGAAGDDLVGDAEALFGGTGANGPEGTDEVYEPTVPLITDAQFDKMMASGGSRPFDNPVRDFEGTLLGKLIDHIYRVHGRKEYNAPTAIAISMVSFLMGKGYVSGTRSTRAFTYMVVVGGSGTGKTTLLNAMRNLYRAVGSEELSEKILSGEPGSMQGLHDKLYYADGQLLNTIDEVGKAIERIGGDKSPVHLKGIKDYWTKCYSENEISAPFSRTNQTPPVRDPAMSIVGAATHDQLYDNYSRDRVKDGFATRWMVVEMTENAPKKRGEKPETAEVGHAMKALYDQGQAFLKDQQNGFDASGKPVFGRAPAPLEVPMSPQADRLADKMADLIEAMTYYCEKSKTTRREVELAEPFLERAMEWTHKLAMIFAVSRDHARPVISDRDYQMAGKATMWMINNLYTRAQGVTNDAFHAMINEIREVVTRSGKAGTPVEKIYRRFLGPHQPHAIANAIDGLTRAGEITNYRGIVGQQTSGVLMSAKAYAALIKQQAAQAPA